MFDCSYNGCQGWRNQVSLGGYFFQEGLEIFQLLYLLRLCLSETCKSGKYVGGGYLLDVRLKWKKRFLCWLLCLRYTSWEWLHWLLSFRPFGPACFVLQVLIGHIKNKMNKQTFSERCSLCQDVLPFTDHKQTMCKNGHMWLRYEENFWTTLET